MQVIIFLCPAILILRTVLSFTTASSPIIRWRNTLLLLDASCEDTNEVVPPLPQAPLGMSAMEQSFREQELEFLTELRDGDAAIHKFRLLWYSERGPDVEATLRQAWKDMGLPDHWAKAETSLVKVVGEDPTYLFPFYLLSKLYCLQGRFQESQTICERILEFKPYHFSVLETMVANCAGLAHSNPDGNIHVLQLQLWSSKRLPPPSEKEKRLAWVDGAIEGAMRALASGKQSNVPKSSGRDEGIIEDTDADTWE